MSNWIERFVGLVKASHVQHTILEDPDGLLEYEVLRSMLSDAGFRIYTAKTDFEVRLIYELHARGKEEQILIVAPPGYQILPDIAAGVHFQVLSLNLLFPNLDAGALRGLSFDALAAVGNIKTYDKLGFDKTVDFLLEHLYGVDISTIAGAWVKEKLLASLLTVVLDTKDANKALLDRLTTYSKRYLPDLSREQLTPSTLKQFVQEKWTTYVAGGSEDLDFECPQLSSIMGQLFVSEVLPPVFVSVERFSAIPKSLQLGVLVDHNKSNDEELERLVQYLSQQRETMEDQGEQWFALMKILAKAKLKAIASANETLVSGFLSIEAALNERFQRFIDNSYNQYFTLSAALKPFVVSKVQDFLKGQPAKRKALLVIDGLNYWQWELLHAALKERNLNISEGASLAYIPTITAWSRQAIFKGAKPDLSQDNSKEADLFKSYWLKAGKGSYEIAYAKFGVHKEWESSVVTADVSILGLVCNDLDEIMHGSLMGDKQLKQSTDEWIRQSGIVEQISALHAQGFTLYITSDHGNVEASGIRNLKIQDKVGAISRSKRHLHFSNETLRDSFLQANTSLNYEVHNNSIVLRDRTAFTDENKIVVTHGGSHLWEVVVPFIIIK